jgi:hypothetical protein
MWEPFCDTYSPNAEKKRQENREVILNKLIEELYKMTDEELIKQLEDNGIKVVGYTPGKPGNVTFID